MPSSGRPPSRGSGQAFEAEVEYVVPVYHPPGLRPRIVVPPHLRSALRVTSDWDEFTSYGEHVACEVLIVPDPPAWDHWPDFVVHQQAHDLTPRILVTRRDAESLRHASGVTFHDVLWIKDGDPVELGDSLERASSHGAVQQCRARFAEAQGLTPELRNALEQAFSSRPAVRKVNGLATLAERDRRTISDAWTRFVGPAPAVRLKAILDLILLLRATQRRHRGERWSRIARALGLNVDILRERAKARLGKPLDELTIEDGSVIVENLARLLAGEEARWPLGDDSQEG